MEEEKIRYKDLSFWLKLAVIGGLITFISFIIVALLLFYYYIIFIYIIIIVILLCYCIYYEFVKLKKY